MNGVTQNESSPQISPEALKTAAAELGRELGLPGPAPDLATRRAVLDPDFAKALYALRNMPELRDQMLAAPDSATIRKPGEVPEAPTPAPSAVKLAAKAAGSVLKWGMDGLKPAQPWVIERRLAACAACEFQAPAPDTLMYRGAKVVVGKDAKICTACHCLTNTKAALSTEQCPKRDAQDPSLSRWQEPYVEKSETGWLWDNPEAPNETEAR